MRKPVKNHGAVTGRTVRVVEVASRPGAPTLGWLRAGPLRLPCALGRSGTGHDKREGDGATPVAVLPLRRAWYRADRVLRPATALPCRAIRPDDGWCDAPGDRNYNRRVARPYPASHEAMWREDGLYDLVVELGWNDAPRRQGRGSAIFMHVARAGFRPTEGCIALRKADLVKLLALLGPRSSIRVAG